MRLSSARHGRSAVKLLLIACAVALTLCAPPVSAQVASQPRYTPTIDLDWMAAVQQDRGWLITRTLLAQTLHDQEHLQTGDLLLMVAGQDMSVLGPLAAAWLLEHVPFETVPLRVDRKGELHAFRGFGISIVTHGDTTPATTRPPDKLPKRGDPAPQFSLLDLDGRDHTLDLYRRQWLLINVWGTWCTPCWQEIPPLNYLKMNYSRKLTVPQRCDERQH